MAEEEPVARVPGWYPHPEQPMMLRWWDGVAWTGHVAASSPPGSPPPPPPAELSRPGAAPEPVTGALPPPPPPSSRPAPPDDVGRPTSRPRLLKVVVGVVGVLLFIGLVAPARVVDESVAKGALRDIAAAQQRYRAEHGTYAPSLGRLDVDLDDAVHAFVATADDRSFCAEASLTGSSRTWRWDTRFDTVEEGRCPV